LGAEFEARSHDYYILLTTADRQFKPRKEIPRFLLEKNVDGVIIAGKINEKLVAYIESLELPLIIVDYEVHGKRHSSVLIDNQHGVEQAIRHLVTLGRKDIAFVAGDLGHPSMAERFTAYKESLAANRLSFREEFIAVDELDTGTRNGYEAITKIFRRGVTPNAICAANDAMAIGCMQYLRQEEIAIPDDVAVIGFDDIELCTRVEPSLSTVRVPKEEMGKLAVQRLVEAMKLKSKAVVKTRIPVELVVRESTTKSAAGPRELRETYIPSAVVS